MFDGVGLLRKRELWKTKQISNILSPSSFVYRFDYVHLQVWVRLLRLKAAVVTLYVKYLSNKHISYGSNHNVYMYQRLPFLPIKEK